jgi:XRE family aerobic/anaerobic benzoate catabolism transcriptional regulator
MYRLENRASLLTAIGSRVRSMRLAAGLTIREFASRADLSMRFVIRLESGAGNISIAGLGRAAAALGCSLHELIPPAEDDGSTRSRVWNAVSRCSGDDLRELEGWFAKRNGVPTPRFIALVGLRGAGKSTVGPMLATRIKSDFVEVDAMIERAAGLSLGEIFTLHGEDYYRRLERSVLQETLGRGKGCVLAPGGSVVTDIESWSLLKNRCITVWLHATPQEFVKRMKRQGDTRPMENRSSAMAELKTLLARREPLYAEAQLTVRTTNKSPASIVRELARAIADQPAGGRIDLL